MRLQNFIDGLWQLAEGRRQMADGTQSACVEYVEYHSEYRDIYLMGRLTEAEAETERLS